MTHRAFGRRSGLTVIALLIACALAFSAMLLQSSAQARKASCKRSSAAHAKHDKSCHKAKHATKSKHKRKRHPAAKPKASHSKRKSTSRTHKKSSKTVITPAVCEDGSEPGQADDGSYLCEDGSEPGCPDGSAPNTAAAGDTLACSAIDTSTAPPVCEDESEPSEADDGSYVCEDGSEAV